MTIRARDLRRNIKELGLDQGITVTLEQALEELSELRLHVVECVNMTQRCITQVEMMVQVNVAMKELIQEMQRVVGQGEEHDAKH